ncbi:uncharacterized protein [Cherax quadricarinatus]|uniref:uncharacterized protein n=1 Tax=Cherax quadricarinatus TaxID=27406 RepID=UPI002377FDBD|nr:uncharacterized protein LOC128684210 [Cherax quadricarinatus]
MWSPVVILLLVASVRGEADADPKPNMELYPQYGTSWAAQHFGTPQEIAAAGELASHRHEGSLASSGSEFLPAKASPSPLFAIRDVQTRPPVRPAIQLLRHPTFLLYPPSPYFLQTIHLRVPDVRTQADVHAPVTAPSSLSFGSQHTAQIPFIQQGSGSTYLRFYPNPVAASTYPFTTRQAIKEFAVPSHSKEDEDDDEGVSDKNYIILQHFPTELASLTSLRDIDNEPVIPAGIVQSTQPSFSRVVFINDKAHPSLHDKKPSKDGSVLLV